MLIFRLPLIALIVLCTPHLAQAVRCSQVFDTKLSDILSPNPSLRLLRNLEYKELREALEKDPTNIEVLKPVFDLAIRDKAPGSKWDTYVDIATQYLKARFDRDELSTKDLEGHFTILIRKERGAKRALEVAERLLKEDPNNIEYQHMVASALLKANRVYEVIEFTSPKILENPLEPRWYIYQIAARNRIDYDGRRSPDPYNRSELHRLLTQARELDGSNFYIVNNYLRVTILISSKQQLKDNLNEILSDVDLARSKVIGKRSLGSVEKRLAELYYKLGDYFMALNHAELAYQFGGDRSQLRLFIRDIETLLAIDQGNRDSYQEPVIHSRDEKQPRYNEDTPDWMAERNTTGFEGNYRDWYD